MKMTGHFISSPPQCRRKRRRRVKWAGTTRPTEVSLLTPSRERSKRQQCTAGLQGEARVRRTGRDRVRAGLKTGRKLNWSPRVERPLDTVWQPKGKRASTLSGDKGFLTRCLSQRKLTADVGRLVFGISREPRGWRDPLSYGVGIKEGPLSA